MSRILQKYVKFSPQELETYANNPESCVKCINTDMHLSMGPYGMASFKRALHELLIRTKVGIYDANLSAIVLGIKNIKVLGQTAALRADDPTLHLLINADFYVFQPMEGAVLHGVVRHISKHQVSALIYRVFNATIRFTNNKNTREGITMDQDISFRIKSFNMANVMPYIEGELLLDEEEEGTQPVQNQSVQLGTPEPEEVKPELELDAIIELIKKEPCMEPTPKKKQATKRKKTEKDDKQTKKVKKVIKAEPM
ncbi:DNA-directed RNA polymerase I subunit RPA43 isoform X1 [Drosophila subobscura]|uniref:DNA-directed RNA polymerase I subunit RPA43 isoform X1 n=1 Tax=Drosophila subobscura TaxID=7241 RepID=UPI00155A42EA|nr:DNA-directed RNA polymerase I subunit RPA43 isoform X1 [Drosophila subobscura]